MSFETPKKSHQLVIKSMEEGDAIIAALMQNDGDEVDHKQSENDVVASTERENMGNKQELEAITAYLAGIGLGSLPESGLIDTPAALSILLDILYGQPTTPPSLFIDIEGVNLSRDGTISILQIFVLPTNRAYLIDVHTLRHLAFSTRGATGHTLKEILESGAIPKVFFDVRNDSDALYSHFQISLAGIQDLQLMELATRPFAKRYVNGLSRCIENDARLSSGDRISWNTTKDKGVRLFAPERGGSYEHFTDHSPQCS